MLRAPLLYAFVATVVTVLGLYFVIFLSVPEYSSKYQIVCEPNYAEPEHCAEYNFAYYLFWVTAGFFESAESLFLALGTFVIAFFTGTLWRSTYNLGKAGDEQLKIAERQAGIAERQAASAEGQVEIADRTARTLAVVNRPYLDVSHLAVVHIPEPPDPETDMAKLGIEWEIKNIGRIPVIVDRMCFTALEGDRFPPEPPYRNIKQTKYVLAPGIPLRPKEPDIFYKTGDFRQFFFFKSARSIYLFGFIDYRDTSGERYTYKFCFNVFYPPDHPEDGQRVVPADCPEGYQDYT